MVDASQGIEAQTLANTYLALENDLEIVPVINKVDLPAAEPERVRREIEDVIGLDASMAPCISAKLVSTSTKCWNVWSIIFPPPPEIPTHLCAH